MKLSGWVSTNRVILSNSSSILSSQLITSVIGFGYWWVAARQFTPGAVGLASASISAMTLLGTASVMGLGTLLLGEIPRQPSKTPALLITALLVAGLAGLVAGYLFALAAPLLSPDLWSLALSPARSLVFAVGVSLTSMTLVLDQAVLGLLRGGLQLWRNIIFAVGKLAVLAAVGLLVANRTGLTIYATWVIGSLFSLAFLAVVAARHKIALSALRPEWNLIRRLGKAALGHHALNISLQLPGMTLPLLVTIVLSTSATAHFYIAWMVASFVFVGPYALTTVLYAVTSAHPARLAHKMRQTLLLATVLDLAEVGTILLGAGLILGLFGHLYAEQAAPALRVLAVGAFPLTIRNHYVAVSRVYGGVTKASLYMMVGGVLELTLASLGGAVGGLLWLTLGWLVAVCIEGTFMLPTVVKAATRRESPPSSLNHPVPITSGQAEVVRVDTSREASAPQG